ncbi:MAG TPA: penicillin acylase family protein, partial [Solirubrobacterales bacterium]
MSTKITPLALVALAAALALPSTAIAAPAAQRITGLDRPVEVVRDGAGVPHVFARSEHDAYFMVGYLHAQDRFFQMDQSRRQAAGRLAELLGPGALPSDVSLRTIGLHRAAERSLAALSQRGLAFLEAY